MKYKFNYIICNLPWARIERMQVMSKQPDILKIIIVCLLSGGSHAFFSQRSLLSYSWINPSFPTGLSFFSFIYLAYFYTIVLPSFFISNVLSHKFIKHSFIEQELKKPWKEFLMLHDLGMELCADIKHL